MVVTSYVEFMFVLVEFIYLLGTFPDLSEKQDYVTEHTDFTFPLWVAASSRTKWAREFQKQQMITHMWFYVHNLTN